MNRNTTLKNNRSYFKSLSIITPLLDNKTSLGDYNCGMTLYFIRRNIHFNLKTESQISQYFAQCSQYVLKIVPSSEFVKTSRDYLVFNDFFLYFTWFFLLLIILSGCKLCSH